MKKLRRKHHLQIQEKHLSKMCWPQRSSQQIPTKRVQYKFDTPNLLSCYPCWVMLDKFLMAYSFHKKRRTIVIFYKSGASAE